MNGMVEWSDWLVYGSVVVVKATVLLGCAYLVSVLLRRRSAAVRHAVWAAAIMGVVALPWLGAAFPSLRVAVAVPGWPAVTEAAPLPAAAPLSAPVWSGAAAELDGLAASAVATRSVAAAADAEAVASGPARLAPAQSGWPLPVSGPAVLLMVWLAGALAVLGYTLLSMLYVHVLARRARELRDIRVLARAHGIASELGVTWPVEVLEGDADAMPMTFGVVSDTLLLPTSAKAWPADRLEAVLRHELAHIRRRDSLTQLVADVGCALYWFHPGVWLAARRLRMEREHACDDVVLLAGARASDYAQELLEIARTMRARPLLSRAALAMAQRSRLRARLVAVLDDRPRAARVPGTLLAPIAVAALTLVMTLAVVTPSRASAGEGSGSLVGDTLPAMPPLPAPAPRPALPPAPQVAPPVVPPPAPLVAPLVAPAPPTFPPPVPVPSAPPVPPVPPVLPLSAVPHGHAQTVGCWGRFTGDGTMIEREDGTYRVRTIQKTVDGVSLCMRVVGDVELDASGTAIRSMGPNAAVVLASREEHRELYLEITSAAGAVEHAWYVDGQRRQFDADAAEWRDAVMSVLHSAVQIASIRGEVASLRGEIASVRGRRASLRGEVASIRGREASLRGQMASAGGRTASLQGQVASIRGREASMRGEIDSQRGRISALENAWRSTTDPATRSRLEAEIGQARAAIEAVERRIAEYDAAGRIAEVEARLRTQEAESAASMRAAEERVASLETDSRIAAVEARLAALDVEGEVARIQARIEALDADGRIAAVEARLRPQEQRLRESLRRIR
jgi:beta-lactamase regulating signal transducer with metallopeptidase domain/predicted  nucleic acid-binding Zn-ribbon protein